MYVNYHALAAYCAQTGGLSFFPDHVYASVNTGSLCFLQGAGQYRHTIAGSYKHLQEGAPDNYFTVYRSVRTLIDQVQIGDILAALRLSLFDSHQLGIFSHRIAALLPIVSRDEAQDLLDVMARCWENYFALQEETDLATVLGSIAYSLDAYEWAIYYFGQSTDIYGGYTGTFYNMAICHHMLGNAAAAIEWLQMVIAHDPQNAAAVALLADYALQPVH
jgi:tetratricopeptide (TPR) repeat protein